MTIHLINREILVDVISIDIKQINNVLWAGIVTSNGPTNILMSKIARIIK